MGVWLQLIIQNTLPVFIENQGYTLAEVPLFLIDADFREYLLRNVRHETEVVDFWHREFQPKQAEPAITRMRRFLSNAYVKHIIGQKETTVHFMEYTRYPPCFVFVRLPADLSDDIKKFIGTIIVSELLHAIRTRPENARKQLYGVYIDEFQHFSAYQDIATLINEGRKFGCGFCGSHQERAGQLGDNQKVLGATQACANKVLFQVTPKDAHEFAPEYAEPPQFSDTRWEPELVICKEPVWNLLHRGHANPRIQKSVVQFLRNLQEKLQSYKDEMEKLQMERTGLLDEASLARDEAQIFGVDERRAGVPEVQGRGRNISMSHAALDQMEGAVTKAMRAHSQTAMSDQVMGGILYQIHTMRADIYFLDNFLATIMETKTAPEIRGKDFQRFITILFTWGYVDFKYLKVAKFYLELRFGDPQKPLEIPAILAINCMPQQYEDFYMQEHKDYFERRRFEIIEKFNIDDSKKK